MPLSSPMMLSSSHSPNPSSFSLHPPLSPAFYPILSPLLQPLPPSTATNSSLSFTSSSLQSTSPLLLPSLPQSSAPSPPVPTRTSLFLNNVTAHNDTSDLSSSMLSGDSPDPDRLRYLSRSVFGSHTSSSPSDPSVMLSAPTLEKQTSESSFDSHDSHDHSEHQVDLENDDDGEDEEEHRDERYSFRLGSLDILSDVIPADNEQPGDSAPNTPAASSRQRTPRSERKMKKKKKDRREAVFDPDRRVQRACIHCSASKTKCDNERPCARCIRTKKASTCQDIPRRKRVGRAKRRREGDTDSPHSHLGTEYGDLIDGDDEDEPVMAICTTPRAFETGSLPVAASTAPTLVAPQKPAAIAPFPAPTVPVQPSPKDFSSQPSSPYMPQEHSSIYWQPSPTAHTHTHTHSFPSPVVSQPTQPVPHSVFASPTHQYSAAGKEPSLSPSAQATSPNPPVLVLPPTHATAASPASPAALSVRSTAASPISLATPRSTASSTPRSTISSIGSATLQARTTASAAAASAIPIGQMLSRLRLRLPRALHRAHAAVIDQFHAWSDLLTVRQQQGLTAPVSLLKARQYVYHMLKDAMVALEDEDRQRRMPMLAGSSTIFSPPLETEHDELLRLIYLDWDEYLFPSGVAAEAVEGPDSGQWEHKAKSTPTLDAILHRRVVPPTFIIPLLSFPFLISPPWMSASFAALLGYDGASFSTVTLSPLDLLHHRQTNDIAPLVPAFLSAITAKADHYLHSSGWVRQDGSTVQLVANVRLMYAEGTGFPVALMAQLTRKEDADASFAPILARMNTGSSVASGV